MGVSIKNVTFRYSGSEKTILENISAEIEDGEFVCILGQSGCGKSTLLRLLAGLEKPTDGELLIDGTPINGADLDRGVVFQDYGLFPWMTAGENILLALRQKYPKRPKQELKEIVYTMLQAVGLHESTYKKLPKELSGGMKQRCAIAQSFSIDPPILLMDEPFGALDAVTRVRIQDLVKKLWQEGNPKKTVFFVTHDVDEAMMLATRILILGQSPSRFIYEVRIPEETRPSRECQFTDPEFVKLRADLIRQINLDVTNHAEE